MPHPIPRRALLAAPAVLLPAAAPIPPTAPGLVWNFEMTSIDETPLRFKDFQNRVLLVVNTASFCSFTPQYTALEKLHRELSPRGFTVLGIPSQDFGQEQGSNGEVKAFCDLTYGVDFPMTTISHVRGPDAAPFYKWVRTLTKWEPHWNFFKVLIDRQGTIAGTYGSDDEPDRGRLRAAIEAAIRKAPAA